MFSRMMHPSEVRIGDMIQADKHTVVGVRYGYDYTRTHLRVKNALIYELIDGKFYGTGIHGDFEIRRNWRGRVTFCGLDPAYEDDGMWP